jgi:hypothetical protein
LYQLGVTEPFLFEFMGQQWVEPHLIPLGDLGMGDLGTSINFGSSIGLGWRFGKSKPAHAM